MSGLDLEKTYFEEHAAEILAAANMNKAQFAKEMGVLPQNINKLIAGAMADAIIEGRQGEQMEAAAETEEVTEEAAE